MSLDNSDIGILILAAAALIFSIGHMINRTKKCESFCLKLDLRTPRPSANEVNQQIAETIQRRLSKDLPEPLVEVDLEQASSSNS